MCINDERVIDQEIKTSFVCCVRSARKKFRTASIGSETLNPGNICVLLISPCTAAPSHQLGKAKSLTGGGIPPQLSVIFRTPLSLSIRERVFYRCDFTFTWTFIFIGTRRERGMQEVTAHRLWCEFGDTNHLHMHDEYVNCLTSLPPTTTIVIRRPIRGFL